MFTACDGDPFNPQGYANLTRVSYAPMEDIENLGSVRNERVTDSRQGGDTPVIIIPGTYTDGTGYNELSSVSNARVIHESYGNNPWLVEVTYAFAGTEYALAPELVDADDSEDVRLFEDALTAIKSLADYPVLDDSDWSDLEYETIEAAWGEYLADDVFRDLDVWTQERIKRLVDGGSETLTEIVREAVVAAQVCPAMDGEYVYFECTYSIPQITEALVKILGDKEDSWGVI